LNLKLHSEKPAAIHLNYVHSLRNRLFMSVHFCIIFVVQWYAIVFFKYIAHVWFCVFVFLISPLCHFMLFIEGNYKQAGYSSFVDLLPCVSSGNLVSSTDIFKLLTNWKQQGWTYS
jgi:hypothetical protein